MSSLTEGEVLAEGRIALASPAESLLGWLSPILNGEGAFSSTVNPRCFPLWPVLCVGRSQETVLLIMCHQNAVAGSLLPLSSLASVLSKLRLAL